MWRIHLLLPPRCVADRTREECLHALDWNGFGFRHPDEREDAVPSYKSGDTEDEEVYSQRSEAAASVEQERPPDAHSTGDDVRKRFSPDIRYQPLGARGERAGE